ncbi:MAG: integrase [Halomonas sp.]|nr:integrase [Halomonas sp.]
MWSDATASGHSKLESAVRYLRIEVDDALEIAEQTEV